MTRFGGVGLRARVRAQSWLLPELMGAMISAALALGSAAAVLRLWRAHANVPITAAGDALGVLMTVKNMQITGWFQGTPDLGAPFGQNLTGNPGWVGDTWNLVALKLLSMFGTPAASVNFFFIVGFPLIAAIAYGCLRLLGVSRPFACALGAVYALLPYHFLRGESHLFLSAYYALPVGCVLALSLYTGRLTLWADRRRMTTGAWAALAGALLLAGTGIYYAAFTLVLVVAAGFLASLASRSWRPLVSAAALAAVTGTGLVLAALPNILHTLPPGGATSVEGRSYGATEYYGLKITNLILPSAGHRIPAFANLHARTAGSPIPGEGTDTLGILGVVGLAAVILAILLPRLHRESRLLDRLAPLGAMAIVALLAGTVAGLNSLLAVLGFAQLRAWNRISVLIGFLALAGIGHLLDAASQHWMGGSVMLRRLVVGGIAGLVLIVGALDQTTSQMVPDYVRTSAGWDRDQVYFTQVQNQLGTGASLFTLPYTRFPESPPIVAMKDYSHLRGYLHSDLRWSYGGLKNEESEWQPTALQDGIAAALPRLVAAGFDAVYVNRLGYADGGAKVESEITAVTGPQTPIVNADGTLATYDLRSYAKRLRTSHTQLPSRESVLHPVQAIYGTGFYAEEFNRDHHWHWAQGSATMDLVNVDQNPAAVILRGAVRVADTSATIRVRVGDHETMLKAVDGLAKFEIPTTAGPGVTPVQISTDSAATKSTPGDTRNLRELILDLAVKMR